MQAKDSLNTKILGNLFKLRYIGVMKNSLRGEDCNLTKHGQTQSFSTTYCLRFVLRSGMHEDQGGDIP